MGLVAQVRAGLERHVPGDEREARSKVAVLDALARLRSPFDEHAASEHVTASALVVGARGTVLHMHKRLGRWLQPGGHVEAGEAPWEAAWREATEETGLALDHPPGGPRLIHLDVHEAARGHVHLDLRYLLLGDGRDPVPGPGESPEARWFGWDRALAVADVALVGALRSAAAQPEARSCAPPGPGHNGVPPDMMGA